MKKILNYILYFIVSYLIGCSIILKFQIGNRELYPISFIKFFHFNFLFFIKSFVVSIVILFVIYLLFKLLGLVKIRNNKNNFSNRFVIIASFIGIFISGLLFLLTYYPGSNMNDTLYIIKSPFSSATQHPLVYNLFLSGVFRIFNEIFNNLNSAFFFTSIIQLMIMDVIITYVIYFFNNKINNKIITSLLLLFFIFLPIVSNYNTVLIKDSLFSGALLLVIPILYKLVSSDGDILNNKKYLISFILSFIFISLVRNNGIYIILFMFIILFIKYYKYRNNLFVCFIIVMIISLIPNLFIKSESLLQEKLAVPIQQIAYVVSYDNNISNNDFKYINNIMKIDKIKDNYNPYSVDSIKWSNDFNRKYLNKTKNNFYLLWLRLLPSHFESYVKSYLLNTYNLWAIDKFNYPQSRFLGINKDEFYDDGFYELSNKFIFPKEINNTLHIFYDKTIIFINEGLCFLILVINILYMFYKKIYKYIIISMPLLSLWITLMISTPLSSAFRYMSPFLYILPFLVVISLYEKSSSN